MVAIISALIFSSAFAVSVTLIVASVAPQWRRIARLASGRIEPDFAPLSTLAAAERRIAVRRWASAPMSAQMRRLTVAA